MGSRLVLHEVHGRWPPITLKPRGRILIGSSKTGELYDPEVENKAVAVTCVLDHHSIAAVQCEIRVSRNGTAELFYAEPFAQAQGSHEGYAKKGATCLNGSAIDPTESFLRRAGNQLRVDDVITFSAHASAPSYVVRAVVSDPPPTSFPVLELPECVLLSSVLPRLSLGTLAKFALASADCARLVAGSMTQTDGHRWSAQSAGIVRTLEAVETRPELMRAVLGAVSAHVELPESRMWELASSSPNVSQSYQFMSRNTLLEAGSEQNIAAFLLLQTIPDAENRQLSLLIRALAVRMTPAQLVSLLTTLHEKTALADMWPHSFTYGDEYHTAPPRLNLEVPGAVSSCARLGTWTPDLLVSMGKALGWTGFRFGEVIQGELGDNVGYDEIGLISTLWMDGLPEAEQAQFLVGLHCFGDRLLEAVNGLVAIAVNAESLSLVLEILSHLDDAACEEATGLGREDDATELRIDYHRAPSEFLSGWSAGRNFPLDFSVEDITVVVDCMYDRSKVSSEAQPYFGALRLEWISELLPPGGGMAKLEVDKVRALSL